MTNARDGSKVNTSLADACRDIAELFNNQCTFESWEKLYGEKYPDDIPDEPEPVKEPEKPTEEKAAEKPKKAEAEKEEPKKNDADWETWPTSQPQNFMEIPEEEPKQEEKKVAPVQPKQLGNLDIGDRVVNVETGETGTMLGHCAGEYKIGIDNGGVTLASKDSIRWAKTEEKKEAEPEPEAEAPEQEEQKQTFDFEKWHETMLADIEALDTMFERNYKAEMWKKEDLWELMEKANKLISDAGIPLKVKAEDGGLK